MKPKKGFSETMGLILILGLGLVLRLYRINGPVADWHSWRQADTAAVTRNFVARGIDLLRPKFDDLSSIASGQPNPEGHRFVEFPIYNAISAFWVKILPSVFTVEISSRIVSIFCSLASTVFIFLIVKKYLNPVIGLASALFFVILPYNIFYSRVILPEPMMIMASLGMIWFFDHWLDHRRVWSAFLTVFFAAWGLLLKPIVVFLALPMAYLGFRKLGLKLIKQKEIYLFLALALIPLVLWRGWMARFPEGIPAYTWLLNQDQIRFKGAFFYWLFAKRLGELILGFWGLILLGLGLILKPGKKEGWFFHVWLLAILAYFTVFATGNVRHDYYQIISIPIVAIFLGKGFHFLIFGARKIFYPLIGLTLSGFCLFFMVAFSWYQIRTYYWINKPAIVAAGQAVDRLLPLDAKVIAPYQGDTAFLYQTKRKGWPVTEAPLEEMKEWGADYLVSVDPQDQGIQDLKKKYSVLEETGDFIVFDLAKTQ